MEKISYDYYSKIKLRVGEIIEAEEIPKSRNLMKLQVDIGKNTPSRQIIARISHMYNTNELIGKKVAVVINLESRKLMGHDSDGLLLMVNLENNPVLVELSGEYLDYLKPGFEIV